MKAVVPFVAASCIAVGANKSYSEETVTLSFSHWLPATHPAHTLGFVPWAEAIEKESGGTIKIDFYPAQQLGKAKDHYDMVENGIADIIWTSPGYSPGRFPIFDAGNLPFLTKNPIDGSMAFDEWYRTNGAPKEMPNIKYCLSHFHDSGALHTKERITHPDQIRGMKVRPANSTIARFVSELGGASVQVSAPESRDAITKGTADAITFPWNSLRIFGIHKAANHHLDMPFYVSAFVVAINQDKYDSLSDSQKLVIDAHCNTEASRNMAKGWANWEMQGRLDTLSEEGQFVYTPTDDEVAAWKSAAAPLKSAWEDDVRKAGSDPEALWESLQSNLIKYESAY